MGYVIIGNSAAAMGCVEGIRSVDPEGAITVVASEPYHTYSRPLISYLLEGRRGAMNTADFTNGVSPGSGLCRSQVV